MVAVLQEERMVVGIGWSNVEREKQRNQKFQGVESKGYHKSRPGIMAVDLRVVYEGPWDERFLRPCKLVTSKLCDL